MKKKLLTALALLCLLAVPALATNTTHYSYVLPTVGASQNVWGTLLNTIFNSIDSNVWSASSGTTIGVNAPSSSGSNITLTNPVNNIQNISFSATGKSLILPAMNATSSLVVGGTMVVNNVGSNAFSIVAQDGSTTLLSSLGAGNTAHVTLLTNGTANGTFTIAVIAGTVPVPVASGGTGAATLTVHGVVVGNATSAVNITSAGTSGQVLTSNGASADPTFQATASVPTGTSIIWTTTTCPSGYTYENGQTFSRTGAGAALFAVIGTTYGIGDGSTTANVPDMRGYFPRGWADDGSIDAGRTFASTQTDAIKTHTVASSVTDPGHSHTDVIGSGNGASINPSAAPTTSATTQSAAYTTRSATTGITVASSYSGSTETRPYNLALVFCIKN